jgi:farnesyl-diphosphate farnesyltransferase
MPTLNQLLHAASRTFAIGIDLLPEPLRAEVEVAYLLLRVSDYLEDNVSMPPEQKAEMLTHWAAVLRGEELPERVTRPLAGVTEDSADALVARNVSQVYEAFRALPRPRARDVLEQHVADSTLGMARWALRGPVLDDEADLDDYMHEVAGRVGWLLTELFALDVPGVESDKPEMMRLGREFGLGLQTVNVIRGLHSDWERGWVYVPRSFVAGAGDPGAIFGEQARDPELEMGVLDAFVGKATRHLDAARRYIARIPRRERGIRLFCLLPYFFAVRTLAVSRANPHVFRSETKISRAEVRRIAAATRWCGWSNRWVAWYSNKLTVI